MSIFGWSLPPGCHELPGDAIEFCEVCGKDEFSCVCPECPVCSEIGKQECYEQHGLVLSGSQRAAWAEAEARWAAQARAEADMGVEEEPF